MGSYCDGCNVLCSKEYAPTFKTPFELCNTCANELQKIIQKFVKDHEKGNHIGGWSTCKHGV